MSPASPAWLELIDTMQFGLPGTGAAYHLWEKHHALIDCGTYDAAGLIERTLSPVALDFLLLTHVHPDHAGAAAPLSRCFPGMSIGVHERGIRHLVDPARINESIRASTGPLSEFYGEMEPIPSDRIEALDDEGGIRLGRNILVEAIETPGHAPHHLCFYERSHHILFGGDALGVNRNGIIVPATVPPSFDYEQSLASLDRLSSYRPKAIYLSHFGPVRKPHTYIDEYKGSLTRWVDDICRLGRRLNEGEVIRQVLRQERFAALGDRLRLELGMCVRGVLQYLERAGR